jgi:hypothetical protein
VFLKASLAGPGSGPDSDLAQLLPGLLRHTGYLMVSGTACGIIMGLAMRCGFLLGSCCMCFVGGGGVCHLCHLCCALNVDKLLV